MWSIFEPTKKVIKRLMLQAEYPSQCVQLCQKNIANFQGTICEYLNMPFSFFSRRLHTLLGNNSIQNYSKNEISAKNNEEWSKEKHNVISHNTSQAIHTKGEKKKNKEKKRKKETCHV